MEFSFYVGVIGNIISVLLFLSPIKTFKRIVEQRSTEEFESLPYVCTLLNSSLWTYYGIIRPGSYLVATVNGFGIFVETIYVVLFLVYAPTVRKRLKPRSVLLRYLWPLIWFLNWAFDAKTAVLAAILDVGFFGAAVLVTLLALHGESRIDAVGILGAGLNIVMYGSPLAVMKTVVMTKSVEYMPFLLSFFMFLNGGVWALYALLVRDLFLGVPNGIGFILGTTQLSLYALYKNAKQQASPHLLEEGWQNQHLIEPPSNDHQNGDEHRTN